MKRHPIAVFFALLIACTGAPTSEPLDIRNAEPTLKVRDAGEVTRVLDFGGRVSGGRLLHRLPYGDIPETLGGARVCLKDGCSAPCPCSTSLVPVSFDLDKRGRAWVLDVVKDRVAVFDRDSSFLFQVQPPGNNLHDTDLQLADYSAYVLRNGPASALQLAEIQGRRSSDFRTVTVNGETVAGDATFSVGAAGITQVPPTLPQEGQGGIYMELLESPSGSDDCCFGSAEIYVTPSGEKAHASSAPGLPHLDGWLTHAIEDYHRIELSSDSAIRRWDREIRLRFRDSSSSKRFVPGIASYEIEVSEDGIIHLVIFAGTDRMNQPNVDGFFYLRIDADGRVSRAVRLKTPSPPQRLPNPKGQFRHLGLDPDGAPLLMWAGARAVRIEELSL